MLEDFRVFRLATELYQRCKFLKMPHFLKNQVLRASSSVAMNIAEGSGKSTPKDQARHYSIALGSLREVQAARILEKIEDPEIKAMADQIGAMLFKLCRIRVSRPTKRLEEAEAFDTVITSVAAGSSDRD